MAYEILIVDDEDLSVISTRLLLEEAGYHVVAAASGAIALEIVRESPHRFALVIMDYRMAEQDGAETTRELLKVAPDLYVLVYSADPSQAAVTSIWKAGALEFIEKGGPPERLLTAVGAWCEKYEQTTKVPQPTLKNAMSEHERLIQELGLVGRSEAMALVARKVRLYRQSLKPVMIVGETGCGKERVAKSLAIHPQKMVAVNCASYRANAELMESELFGHERGAFTGADRLKRGIFETVGDGVIFLDEVHHLSITAQAKLLRVIQEGCIRRVGGTTEIAVHARVLTATKPQISKLVEAGDFLPDLYHRLNVLTIDIPPLRERMVDIEPLVLHFCHLLSTQLGQPCVFLKRTIDYLKNYEWPGNVRELENQVYRLVTEHPGEKIAPEHLEAKFFKAPKLSGILPFKELKARFEQAERENIQAALKNTTSKRQAAKLLGVTTSTFHSILIRVGLA